MLFYFLFYKDFSKANR